MTEQLNLTELSGDQVKSKQIMCVMCLACCWAGKGDLVSMDCYCELWNTCCVVKDIEWKNCNCLGLLLGVGTEGKQVQMKHCEFSPTILLSVIRTPSSAFLTASGACDLPPSDG